PAEQETGAGGPGGADVEGAGTQVVRRQLGVEFERVEGVGGGPEDLPARLADDVGAAAGGPQLLRQRLLGGLQLRTQFRVHEPDAGPEQPVQEQVALDPLRLRVAAEAEEALDAQPRAGRRRLPAVVAVRRRPLDDAVRGPR